MPSFSLYDKENKIITVKLLHFNSYYKNKSPLNTVNPDLSKKERTGGMVKGTVIFTRIIAT